MLISRAAPARSEYWWFLLFQLIAYVVLGIVFGIIGSLFGGSGGGSCIAAMILIILLMLALFIPNLAVHGPAVPRSKPQRLASYCCSFIPYVGSIVMIIFMCVPRHRWSEPFRLRPRLGTSAISKASSPEALPRGDARR